MGVEQTIKFSCLHNFPFNLQMMGIFSFGLCKLFVVAIVRGLVNLKNLTLFKVSLVCGLDILSAFTKLKILPSELPTKCDVILSRGTDPIVTDPSSVMTIQKLQHYGPCEKK